MDIQLVLPHLQYCLMVWGDFAGCGNVVIGGSLLRQQKRFAGLVAGRTGRYHSDPLFAAQGMLKVGDLYRQQLRVYAWQFWNGRLPENQAALLRRTGEVHGHATRSARSGLFLSTRDRRSVGYRVPREWGGSRRSIGGLHHWRPSRGGQGGVFWPGMGCLSVGIGGVGCVGVQGLCNLAGWALGTCGARFSNGLKLGSTIVFTVRE